MRTLQRWMKDLNLWQWGAALAIVLFAATFNLLVVAFPGAHPSPEEGRSAAHLRAFYVHLGHLFAPMALTLGITWVVGFFFTALILFPLLTYWEQRINPGAVGWEPAALFWFSLFWFFIVPLIFLCGLWEGYAGFIKTLQANGAQQRQRDLDRVNAQKLAEQGLNIPVVVQPEVPTTEPPRRQRVGRGPHAD